METAPWASDDGDSDSSPPPPLSSTTPSSISLCLSQLTAIISQNPTSLSSLLFEKNVEGHTPFMAAVAYKVF